MRLASAVLHGQVHDGAQLLQRREGHQHLEQEAVQLRFRQRVGTFLLHRVLGSQHKIGFRQSPGFPGHGHGMFLHRLQQGSLRLGGRAVDFVRQHDGGEQRALLEAEGVAFLSAHQDIGTGNIRRHQVRRKLNAGERKIQHLPQHPHQVGLAQSRHTFQQHVAAGNHRQQQVFHHVCLADHFLGNFRPDLLILPREFLHGVNLLTHGLLSFQHACQQQISYFTQLLIIMNYEF